MYGKELAEEVKKATVRAKEKGSTYNQVAALFGVGTTVVYQIYKRFLESNTVANLQRSVRPRKSTERNDRSLVKIVKDDSKKTATDMTKYANERLKLGITTRTARNILKRCNLPAAKPSKKPWISKKNFKAHLKFARAHLDWPVADWGRVLWSFTKTADLFKVLAEEWKKISLDVVIKLVESMQRCCAAVIASKGYATKY